MDPVRIYEFITKSREIIFNTVRELSPEQYERLHTIGLKTLGTTLTHMMIVEWAYSERMQGRELPPYETWPIQDEKPPAFAVIEKTWREQAPGMRLLIESMNSTPQWEREFQYISKSREGKKSRITVTPADIFTQLVLHEIHHRAQLMFMLREAGSPVENLDFGYLMFKREMLE
jgi:uncharacterized damage-inducible protein DinB